MNHRRVGSMLEVIGTYFAYFVIFKDSPVADRCEKQKWNWASHLQHSAWKFRL